MRGESTEFFNISGALLAVMRCIGSGEIHRREIEDQLKISERNCVRAIDKLADAGLVALEPARDPGRGGKSARQYRCHPTKAGFLMLMLCDAIVRHRKVTEKSR